MKQDSYKLFETIENADNLSESKLEELLASLSDEEGEMFRAMIATKQAMQHSEALKIADGVAEEDWKAFERRNFSNNSETEIKLEQGEIIKSKWIFMSKKSLLGKIAAAVAVIVLFSGITLAAITGFKFSFAPQVETDDVEETMEQEIGARTEVIADSAAKEAPQTVIFDEVTLETMLSQMAASYGVSVRFTDENLRTIRMHYEWNKSLTLENNVQLLNNFSKIEVSIENKFITVSNTDE